MRRLPRIFFLLSLLLVPAGVFAQNDWIELLPDKKVIYIDKLGLPGNTPVRNLLVMIPALTNRSGGSDSWLENFDIQYDGQSVGDTRDVFLNRIMLSDIEKIMISTSPTVTQQKNGEGGVVNIVPRTIAEGVGGEAFLALDTDVDILPSVSVTMKKGRFSMYGNLSLDFSKVSSPTRQEAYVGDYISISSDTLRRRYFLETLRLDFRYDISSSDVLKVWLRENWHKNSGQNISMRHDYWKHPVAPDAGTIDYINYYSCAETWDKDMGLYAAVRYEHIFNKNTKLVTNAYYSSGNGRQYSNDVENEARPQEANGDFTLEFPLVVRKDKSVTVEAGGNLSYSVDNTYSYKSNSLYLSPFANLKYKSDALQVFLGGRYQYHAREYSMINNSDFTKTGRDVTANLNVRWQINPRQALRLIANRNLIRPGDAMLYPVFRRQYSMSNWIVGNAELSNPHIHSTEIAYIHNWKKERSSIEMNAGIGYDRADDIIESTRVIDENEGMSYTTYLNSGTNDILKADLSIMLRRGIFSLAFAGNLFCNYMESIGGSARYNYYNLSLAPLFHFEGGWILGGMMAYNSKIDRKETVMGDCFFSSISLGRTWGNWTVNAELSDIFDFISTDVTIGEGQEIYSTYDLYPRYFAVGASYKF